MQLKNIVEPIRVYSLDVGQAVQAKPAPPPAPEKSAPPRLSMAVLPFANIGGDPQQEHFVDGVTESLTTDLSRIRGAYVVARNTAFTYKGKSLDVKTIGRELNVRYVLEGSVQRGGNRMRVNVQLIDAEMGSHLWAERFDKPLADLFDMQDEIVARLAGALNAHLIAAEARRAQQAASPNSMDLHFQGLAWYNKGLTPDNVAQARGFFDRALAADPGNVDALVGSARVDAVEGALAICPRSHGGLRGCRGEIDQGLVGGAGPRPCTFVFGLVDISPGAPQRASPNASTRWRWIEISPNAHSFIGRGKIFVGRAEETEAHVAEGLRLSPRDTMAYVWMAHTGIAKLQLGCFEEAVAWCRTGDRGQPKLSESIFSVGRRPCAAWSTRARRVRQSRPVSRSTRPSPFPRPRRLDGRERRPDVSRPARAHSRRHAQGRGPRRMTATRRIRRDPRGRRRRLLAPRARTRLGRGNPKFFD